MTTRGDPERRGPPGWLLIHPGGTIAAADPAACALLRVSDPAVLIQRPWSALVAPGEETGPAEDARAAGRAWRGTLGFVAADGGVVTLAVDLAGIDTPDRLSALRLAPLPPPLETPRQAERPENLRARAEAIEALYEVADLAASARALLQTVREEVAFDWAAVLRFTEEGGGVAGAEVVAVYPASMAGVRPGLRWSQLDPAEAAVLESGEPSIAGDGGHEASNRSPLRRLPAFGMRSRLHLPLFGVLDPSSPSAEPVVVGCVVLCHHAPGTYGPLEGMRAERLLARLGDRLGTSERAESARDHRGPAPPTWSQPSPGSPAPEDTEAPPDDLPEWPAPDDETRFSALGEIVAGVAHELNNPLTAILGYTQLLGSLADREREQAIRTIEEEAQRAARVVRNLLSFARQGTRRAQPVNLDLVLRRVVEVRRYSLEVDNITLVTRFSPVAPVLSDESQMEEVFLALLGNAHEVLRDQGGGELTISIAQIGNRVRVSIADNGAGVPADLRRRIFEPFFTTRPDRQGMGLAAVYGIVQEHRGQVWVEDSPSGGANFIVELPVAPGASTPGPAPEGGSERILVVDDEPPIRALTREILGAAGYDVDVAANGLEALALIETGDYALVIADLRMPAMGGADLYDEISVRWPDLQARVIFITGDMDGEESGRTLARGQVRYLEKPFSTNSLLSIVRQALEDTRA